MKVLGGIFAVLLVIFGLGFILMGIDGCLRKFEPGTRQTSVDGAVVVNIEGCEYFRLQGYGFSYTLTHKGNCTNSIHWKVER